MVDELRIQLSVVVPLYNEEESVGPLHEAITAALAPLGIGYELLLVDDGSRDRTVELVRGIVRGDARVRLVKFRRNYGQTAAMAAGIAHARGKVIVTMDGDLQNDPQDIAGFLQQLDEGYDMVVGWRYNRQDKLITRKVPSWIANWMIGKVTGVPIRDNGCSLKAFRADLIKRIPLYSELHRFIPAMASIAGARVKEVRVRHHARKFGKSKYGLSRIYKVLLDLLAVKTITAFGSMPLRWFALLSVIPGFLGLGIGTWCLVGLLQGVAMPLVVPMGVSLLLMTLAGFLLLAGVFGELIHETGDINLSRMPLLSILDQEGKAGIPTNENYHE